MEATKNLAETKEKRKLEVQIHAVIPSLNITWWLEEDKDFGQSSTAVRRRYPRKA